MKNDIIPFTQLRYLLCHVHGIVILWQQTYSSNLIYSFQKRMHVVTQEPGGPSAPGTQLPPPEVLGNPPHPEPGSAPQAGVPMTDGTPAACRQKNAQEFLAGKVPGVMAQYAPGLFSTLQHTHSAHPAPDEDADAVQQLVEWRENAPYG